MHLVKLNDLKIQILLYHNKKLLFDQAFGTRSVAHQLKLKPQLLRLVLDQAGPFWEGWQKQNEALERKSREGGKPSKSHSSKLNLQMRRQGLALYQRSFCSTPKSTARNEPQYIDAYRVLRFHPLRRKRSSSPRWIFAGRFNGLAGELKAMVDSGGPGSLAGRDGCLANRERDEVGVCLP